MPRHILTAVAWPYANGPRHIGHVSGFGVPSDVFSRYMRMAGHHVLMVSGTDEHGTPIQVQADAEGMSTRELADRYNRVIVEDLARLGLSYDLFTRTTTRNHYAVVQELFATLHRNGYVVAKTTMGAISPSTGRTLPDRYIEGTCPICGYDSARGDQCDNCGNQLDPTDLINPRSRINGETPEFVETEHFFLDLPALADALGAWLAERTDWRPERPEVLDQPARGPPAARDHPRPRLGRADPAGRLGRADQQAHLRLVRRGHRLPVGVDRVGPPQRRPRGVAEVVAARGRRRRLVVLLHGQGQHRLPLGDLAGHAARVQRQGRPRRQARRAGRARPAHRGRLERVPHDGGPQVLVVPRGRHLRPRLPGPLRRRRAALLHRGRRPGGAGHRLHLGRVPAPQQRRAGRRLGQPGQPHGLDGGEEHRLGAAAG